MRRYSALDGPRIRAVVPDVRNDDWVNEMLDDLADLGAERREAEGEPAYVGIPVGWHEEIELYLRGNNKVDMYHATWDDTLAYDASAIAVGVPCERVEEMIREVAAQRGEG